MPSWEVSSPTCTWSAKWARFCLLLITDYSPFFFRKYWDNTYPVNSIFFPYTVSFSLSWLNSFMLKSMTAIKKTSLLSAISCFYCEFDDFDISDSASQLAPVKTLPLNLNNSCFWKREIHSILSLFFKWTDKKQAKNYTGNLSISLYW